jgi:hypothetical protein
MGSRPVAMIAAAFLALVAGTCQSDDDSSAPSRTTTTRSPETEVETSYLAFADMGARLLQDPDPTDPEIGERAAGDAKDELVASLQALRDAGLRYELGPEYAHQVLSTEIQGSGAVVDVCVIDDSKQVNAASGEVTAEGVTTVSWTVNMLREDDSWLVQEITEDRVQEGVAECI